MPGMSLEDVFSTFILPDADFRVVSHAEQLRLSACARSSESRLWCGSCHDPHPAARVNQQQKCQSCHPGVQAKHQGLAEDCVGCHMPQRPVSDVAHTAYTDHRIAKRPNAAPASGSSQILQPWRASPNGDRALAIAFASSESLETARDLLRKALSQQPRDPQLLISAGSVALGLKQPAEALRYFATARKLEPAIGDHHFREGLAHEANQDINQAMLAYRETLKRKPSHFDATARLASIERRNGDLAAYRKTLQAFLETSPQNISVRKLLAEK